MTLKSGTRLGPYEVEAPLGKGGMGEVYRARDTRLERRVAVKILPEHPADLSQRRARFEREAKAISQLNHPHICSLYDVGRTDGFDYLVMELLEGVTLSERLTKGPLPAPQVLRYGIDIADALEAAHKRGIVHRDLKPGNVMLTKDGVKLLDFGLAKPIATLSTPVGCGGEDETEEAPPDDLTRRGSILGTLQYMAPEQLEGKQADTRTDLFALACVIYEMATGRRPFVGESRASLIGSILKENPEPISNLPGIPPGLDRLVQTCLAKDPEERLQTAHDVKLELQWLAADPSLELVTAGRINRRHGGLAWVLFTLLAIVTVLAVSYGVRSMVRVAPSVRTSIELPAGFTLDSENSSLAISPNGRTLALAGWDSGGSSRIYLRALNSLATRPLAGTEGATYPFWSPDGRSLGFFADGKIKKISTATGAVQSLAEAPRGRGAAWVSEDAIVYAPDFDGALWRVSVAAGTSAPLEPSVAAQRSHRNPHFLPGSRSLLYFSLPILAHSRKPPPGEQAGIYTFDLTSRSSRLLVPGTSEGRFVAPGYLAFVRNNDLLVQPFNPESMRLSGEAKLVAHEVQANPLRGTAQYDFAGTDLLVYQPALKPPQSQLTWYNLAGKKLSTVGKPMAISQLALAPSGRRAVAAVGPKERTQLWMIDLETGAERRFSIGARSAANPVWSPDGRRLIYTAKRGSGEERALLIREADGGAPPRVIHVTQTNFLETRAWSPDGSAVALALTGARSSDIGIVRLDSGSAVEPILHSPAKELSPTFSPDGRWLAYRSDQSGRYEVYVSPYPGLDDKWQVTSGGSEALIWANKATVFNMTPGGQIHAIDLKSIGKGLRVGASRPAFGKLTLPSDRAWDYSPALGRILVAVPTATDLSTSLTAVTNWETELAKP